jgi:hypothetical protein
MHGKLPRCAFMFYLATVSMQLMMTSSHDPLQDSRQSHLLSVAEQQM